MLRSIARSAKPNSDDNHLMDPVKLQFRSARSSFRTPTSKIANPRVKYCLCSSIFAALILFSYALLYGNQNNENKRYGILIDGGSTGTRIHVFSYEIRNGNSVYNFSGKGLVSKKVNPGLSNYAKEPERAGIAIAELMEFAKMNVPEDRWGETEVRLMATAGMRLLKNEDQVRVLNECRKILKASGFRFQDDWASVISGSDEGLYAWVVANYALGTLGADPAQTTGIVELGGASAQVVFVSDEPVPAEYARKVKFGNFTYNLYSHSLLQFGQNVAFDLVKKSFIPGVQESATESLQSDPCTPKGYSPDKNSVGHLSILHPMGNFSACRSATLKLLNKGRDNCNYQSCNIGSTYIPKLQGNFLATENFFYTSKFFGLRERAFLSDLAIAGQQFCSEDWSELAHKYNHVREEDLRQYCFSSAYILSLLHDSLGIALNDQRIMYGNQVHNIPLDWALGAFILQTSADDHSESIWISSPPPWLLLLAPFIMLCVAAKWRKPQLKTVYDLEKGKYIVTHINRCT